MEYRKKIIVGSRESPLAMAQVDIFFKLLKNLFGEKFFYKLEQKQGKENTTMKTSSF